MRASGHVYAWVHDVRAGIQDRTVAKGEGRMSKTTSSAHIHTRSIEAGKNCTPANLLISKGLAIFTRSAGKFYRKNLHDLAGKQF